LDEVHEARAAVGAELDAGRARAGLDGERARRVVLDEGHVGVAPSVALVVHPLVAEDVAQVAVVEIGLLSDAVFAGSGDARPGELGGLSPVGPKSRLELGEVARHVLPAPAGPPGVEVLASPAGVHHRVDRAAAAHASPCAGEEAAAVAARLRDREALVHQRIVDEGLLVAVRAEGLGVVLRAIARLEQEHLVPCAREHGGHDAAGRAAADDDEVSLTIRRRR
jgi:hypothetical protein